MTIKNENYIMIQGWMINELQLKGNELIIYSVIYGFSQTQGQKFTGGIQYLADWTNSTKRGVMKNLKSLCEKGLLQKEEIINNNVKYCSYVALCAGGEQSSGVVNKVHKGGEQSSLGGEQSSSGVVNKVQGGSEQSSPNNINNNIINNINNNIYNNNNEQKEDFARDSVLKKEKKKRDLEILNEEFENVWGLYPNKKGKAIAFKAYCKFRQATDSTYATKQEVIDGILNYRKYITANGTPMQYVKYGSTFFNEQGWKDNYEVEGLYPSVLEVSAHETATKEENIDFSVSDYDWLNGSI